MNIQYWREFTKNFCYYMFKPVHTNPGLNITSILTIGGFFLMGLSALLHQFGYGEPDPFVIEIGKAAFYTGLGRAYTQAEVETNGDNYTDE